VYHSLINKLTLEVFTLQLRADDDDDIKKWMKKNIVA
jgi:hypothetical protein